MYSNSLASIFREKPGVCILSFVAGSSEMSARTFVEFMHTGVENKLL